MTELGEYDIVALIEDIPEENLVKGEVGTIVNYLAPGVFLVEFADDDGVTYALPVVREEQLSLIVLDKSRIDSY